ncbi:Rad52/Rad22 family DNA repair protein, partial [Sphingobium olei]
CTIAIKCGDEWISKSDGAGDTDVEGQKGAVSDAFKRAAVKWGVGRYLYDMDAVWAECESYEKNGKKMWKRWTARGAAQLNAAAGNVVAPVLPRGTVTTDERLVSREELTRLQNAADDVGADLQAFCAFMKVQSLKHIPQSRFEEAMNALSKKKKAA